MKDLIGLKLKDIASGITNTSFIFERENGSLTGFKVYSNGEIVEVDFKETNKGKEDES